MTPFSSSISASQVTQLIARRVREAGVYCEIHPFPNAAEAFAQLQAESRDLVRAARRPLPRRSAARAAPFSTAGVPMLGICYGQQTMAAQLGGKVESGHDREFGRAVPRDRAPSALFEGVWAPGERYQVWMSHGDRVTRLPEGFDVIGDERERALRGRRRREAPFLLRCSSTPRSCTRPTAPSSSPTSSTRSPACKSDWTMAAFRARDDRHASASRSARRRVICGLSGGVDSTVAAVLIHEAIGDQLTCVFVDHGLMRLGEAEEVVGLFRDHYNIPLVHVDASEQFLKALAGVTDPETKRKTIGKHFIDVFEAEARKIAARRAVEFLAQGTLYPDVIESVSFTGGPSVTIKSHHNVGGLPERMNMKLVEPLRELFKDEVRALGRELGLPEAFVGRHPFPGPGLAIRIPGEITREKLDILRKADAIYLDEIRTPVFTTRSGRPSPCCCPFARSASWATAAPTTMCWPSRRDVGRRHDRRLLPFDMAFLGRVATRIINEVRASTASSTTSRPSRPARSSGNDFCPSERIRNYARVRP